MSVLRNYIRKIVLEVLAERDRAVTGALDRIAVAKAEDRAWIEEVRAARHQRLAESRRTDRLVGGTLPPGSEEQPQMPARGQFGDALRDQSDLGSRAEGGVFREEPGDE